MKDGYIAILDSGIGGLSVLEELIKLMPNEKFLYFGDNYNAPYGNRTKTDLIDITVNNILSIIPLGVKVIVFGCNTLSTAILGDVAKYFPSQNFFGTFPPVEINLIKNRKTLLLCTLNTAKNFRNSKTLTVLPLEELALDIEKKAFNLTSLNFANHVGMAVDKLLKKSYVNPLTTFGNDLTTEKIKLIFDHQLCYFDAVIMGCTHYNFIKNQIFNHFRPHVLVGGEYFTAKKVKAYLENSKTLVKTKQNHILFFGKNSNFNAQVFKLNSSFNSKSVKKI